MCGHRWLICFGLGVLTVGCGEGAEPDEVASLAVRDSSGIQVVEISAGQELQRPTHTVGAEPQLVIGGFGAPTATQLYKVRTATRLKNGTVAIFNGGSQELLLVAPSGELETKVGGRGGGPGEFRQVEWVHRLSGDSLMLYDSGSNRLTVISPDGTPARTVNIASATAQSEGENRRFEADGRSNYEPIGPFADGTFLARAPSEIPAGGQRSSIRRDSVTYVRLAADGELLDTLATLQGSELTTSIAEGEISLVAVTPPPFGRTSHLAIDSTGFWFGSGDRHEFMHYTARGSLDRILRRDVEPITIRSEHRLAGVKAELATIPPDGPAALRKALRRMIEDKWRKAELPPTMPAHGRLMTDPNQRLWVETARLPTDSVPRWSVYGADAGFIGIVAMPPNFRVLELGKDYVLGLETDSYDLEQIVVYPLSLKNQ